MSFHRKRVALACTYCRHRKRRCDATKPSCRNCVESGVDCQYDDTPSQRIDTTGGSREILNRLRDIETLLEEQAENIAALSVGSQAPQPAIDGTSPQSHSSLQSGALNAFIPSNHDHIFVPQTPYAITSYGLEGEAVSSPPLTIPVKHKTSSSYLLGLPAMKALIGEYPTDLFFLLESRNPLPPELSPESWPSASAEIEINRETTDYLVSAFFSAPNLNHPILDEHTFHGIYARFLETGIDSSLESALCLVVLAIGAVTVSSTDAHSFKTSPPGMEYIQYAMPTLISLSSWSFSYSILLPQALVLGSVYFAYIIRPLQSWRLIYSASTILQFKLSGFGAGREEAKSLDMILRLFWSCFLVECDRLAELELPRSGLQQLTDETSLPICTNLDPMQSTCFLAEISIRRLLNRIHNSLYPRKQHILALSSTTLMAPDEISLEELTSMQTVCDELHRQLDVWHNSIPEPHRPSLDGEPSGNGRETVLRIRYLAARHIIYRPFVLYITTHGAAQLPPQMLDKAALCLETCRIYLHNVAEIMKRPSQYTWTFSLSSLGAIVVLTLSSICPDLKHLVPDIDELQTLAINNIKPWAVSSLEAVVSILEDMQRKQRILSRV